MRVPRSATAPPWKPEPAILSAFTLAPRPGTLSADPEMRIPGVPLTLCDYRRAGAGFLAACSRGTGLQGCIAVIPEGLAWICCGAGQGLVRPCNPGRDDRQDPEACCADGRRSANGRIALRVPPDVIKAKIIPYRRRGKPWHRPGLQNLDDHDIVRTYGAEYRGIVNYYLLAQDVWRLGTLCWYAQTSMLKPWPPSTSPPWPRWPPGTRRKLSPATAPGPASRPDGTARARRTW